VALPKPAIVRSPGPSDDAWARDGVDADADHTHVNAHEAIPHHGAR
jgi:hypothetical protein